MNATPPAATAELDALFAAQKAAYAQAGGLDLPRRAKALDDLARVVAARADHVADAISDDFGHRSRDETRLAEIFPVVAAARHARKHLKQWVKPERRAISLMFRPGSGWLIYQPLGVVGIMSPWNYPLQLALSPLVSAIAAGNRVLLKPSELTPRTNRVITDLLGEILDTDEVAVVQGGPDVARAFAKLAFDHLLFTGSTAVGREVMAAAAECLVPVTLELGGKSPVILAPDFPLREAAERIAVGKLFNAGQTCIAPDYVLLPEEMEEPFAKEFEQAVSRLYPTFLDNPDYTSIVSERHWARLRGLLEEAAAQGARLRTVNPARETFQGSRKMPPAVLTQVPANAKVLQEEIFGPLLPLVPYRSIADAYSYVNARPRPLALYLFSRDSKVVEETLRLTVAGGVTVNDTLLHCVQDDLPFGGVGDSGMGSYHGEAGFRTFSHAKGIFHQSRLNGAGLTKPPYGGRIKRLLGLVLR
jgi:coniferyl-aldehyde dehydrogenase